MKNEKIISIGLAAAVLSSYCGLTALAQTQESINDVYTFVDLPQNANCTGFVETGATCLGDDGKRYTQTYLPGENQDLGYQSTGIEFTVPNYIGISTPSSNQFNAEAWENKKQDGYIYDNNNSIPFDVKTNVKESNMLLLNAAYKGEETISVENGNYTDFYFLFNAVPYVEQQYFTLRVNYTDGTYTEDDSWKIYGTEWSDPAVFDSENAIVSYLHIISEKDETGIVKKTSGMYYRMDTFQGQDNYESPLDAQAYLPVYKLSVDPLKSVESISVANTIDWASAILIAATGKKANGKDIANAKIKMLPTADEITVDNYFNYIASIKEIDTIINSGAVLDDADMVKFNGVKDAVESFSLKYTTFDLSGSANSVIFGTTGNNTEYTISDYMSQQGTIKYILNKTAFDNFKKSDGNIYSQNGFPFNIRTEADLSKNAILLGGYQNAPTKVTIPVTEGNYSEIAFVNTAINGGWFRFNMRIVYTDGTYDTDENWNKVYGQKMSVDNTYLTTDVNNGTKAVTSTVNEFSDNYDGNNLKNTALMFNYGEDHPIYGGYYMPVYSMKADPLKTVKEVEIEAGDLYTCFALLGMTGINADDKDVINAAIEKLTEEITLDNYMKYIKYTEMIENRGLDKLTEEQTIIYNNAKSIIDENIKQYKSYDIFSSYTENSIIYANPEEENLQWDNSEKFLHCNTVNGYQTKRALNIKALEALMKENSGYVYDSNRVPFKLNTTGGVILGGQFANAEQTIEINADKCVEKLAFLTDVTHSAIGRAILGTINYEDGTATELKTYTNDTDFYDGAMLVFKNHSGKADINKLFLTDKNGTTDQNTNTLYSYYIPVENDKKVKSITVYGNDSWVGAVILAVTGVGVKEETTEDILDEYVRRIDTLTKSEIDEAYELLRVAVKNGDIPQWLFYEPIVAKKAQSGVITINDVKLENKTLSALVNVADTENEYNYELVAAVYDNDRLLEVKSLNESKKVRISKDGTYVSGEFLSDLSGKTIKCFALESFELLIPISEVIVK